MEISGIDRITMPPTVIEGLTKINKPVELKLTADLAKNMDIPRIRTDEKNFRWLINEDEIGNEKLAEGIRLFTQGMINI